MIFFIKQKTAYAMRISDWSSDVCSSDLAATAVVLDGRAGGKRRRLENRGHLGIADHEDVVDDQARRAADADVGARLLVTGDIDGRTIGQVQGDLVGTVGPGSVYPTQAIGPAQVVVAAGFRGVQHVDDVEIGRAHV